MVNSQARGKLEGTVVVLIEYQKQWTKPGLYNWIISGVLKRNDVIANSEKLVQRARELGIPVIHAPLVVDPKNKKGLFAIMSQGLVFRKGSEAAKIDERVYKDSDIVIKGRTAFDAFVNSDLEKTLKGLDAKKVLLGGFITDQCLVKTLKTARLLGFDALLLSDCSATFSQFVQRRMEKSFAAFTTDSTILDQLS